LRAVKSPPLEQKGAIGASAGSLARRLHDKIHAKADASGTVIGVDLTGGEASEARPFRNRLDIEPY
jgi:hypothetical protein